METVNNRLKPLKLGYVMMRNRSQEEIAEGTSLAQAKSAERRFFETHDVYSKLQPHLVGAESLTTRLADLLVRRIKSVLPVMKVTPLAACVPRLAPERRCRRHARTRERQR